MCGGTLPAASHSSLASDGVAFFVMIHRALTQGANYISNAQIREAARGSLPPNRTWKLLDGSQPGNTTLDRELHSAAFESAGDGGNSSGEERSQLIALNRPASEDDPRVLNSESLSTLFAGLDYREIKDEVGSETSLASEIWRAFLVAMALALLIEAALCIPPKPDPVESPT